MKITCSKFTWVFVLLCLQYADSRAQTFSNTIWAGYLTGKVREVAHYQGNVKGASVTGATANQVPVEIWFPSETNFCVVFNNRTARASNPEGDRGILVHDASLYDIVVGQNPAPSNPMLSYWQGTGTVDKRRGRLLGNDATEQDDASMRVVATYRYKKSGSRETLTVTGSAMFAVQDLDSLGDGWKLNPGVVTYTATFTKTTNRVSVEGLKQGIEGF